jgi:DNA-binding transcriptional ArsR family regulator
MIDRIRRDIQARIEQLHAEADKLTRALAALDPRGKPASKPAATRTANRSGKPAAKRAGKTAGSSAPAAASSPAVVRTARGETKAKVLGALSSDGGMTAGEVAKATGLERGTVSTTLSKLAKAGQVTKAERGYRLPAAS